MLLSFAILKCIGEMVRSQCTCKYSTSSYHNGTVLSLCQFSGQIRDVLFSGSFADLLIVGTRTGNF